MPHKWEYKIIIAKHDKRSSPSKALWITDVEGDEIKGSSDNTYLLLNELGQNGWELVSVISDPISEFASLFMKRKIE